MIVAPVRRTTVPPARGSGQSLTLVLATALPAAAAGEDARDPTRVFTPNAAALVRDAARVSETVRALLGRLAASDLVVLVEVTDQQGPFSGDTSFVTCAGGFRYVLVRVSRRLPVWDQIAVLGHELQHAVEVAEAPEVVSDPTLAQLFTRIGRPVRKRTYETDAAIAVLRQVGAEVRGR
jgi:hypothetical protein